MFYHPPVTTGSSTYKSGNVHQPGICMTAPAILKERNQRGSGNDISPTIESQAILCVCTQMNVTNLVISYLNICRYVYTQLTSPISALCSYPAALKLVEEVRNFRTVDCR